MGTCTISTIRKEYVEACEALYWEVHEYTCGSGENRVELESWSPLGENLVLDFSAENFVDELKEYAADFDPEGHAEELIEFRGTRGIPRSIRALLDDADEIDEMLQKLAEKICEAADEIDEEDSDEF